MPPLAAQGASSEFATTSAADQSNEKTSKSRTIRVLRTVKHHVKHHVGIGIVCSVAYFDPGNWSVDLQAGSQFGYRPLLFIILLAGLGAIILQSLASKLGCVTGQDLASHCRLLLHDRPKHRKLVRYSILYPLYVLSEIGIVCTDLAELLGSAIGLCLLFPSIPLWAAVLVTAADVLVFLVIGGPTRGGKPVKVFEYVIIALVFTVFACFIVLLVQVKPQWSSVFLGYIPSEKLFDTHTDVLYIAVGILGATVMPHALFLGSFLATQDRTASTVDVSLPYPIQADEKAASYTPRARLRTWFKSLFDVSRAERIAASREYRTKYGRENNELSFIRGHLTHGIVDIVTSLIGVAVPINSAILILAAAVFFKSNGESSMPASLFDAHQLIVDRIGNAAGVVFALALLFAGQTSSITATLAGQVVSEGFIEWHISPFLRRLVTRMIGLVPSMVVAIAVGRTGINTLLVASQVALSVVLPFVAFPLIWLTSSKSIMSVRVPHKSDTFSNTTHVRTTMTLDMPPSVVATQDGSSIICESVQEVERPSLPEKADDVHVENVAVSPDDDEYIDFSNGRLLTLVSVLIFIIVLAANLYVFVMLGLGRT